MEGGEDRRFFGNRADQIRGNGSMTFLLIVFLVWSTGVSLGKPPMMATALFLDLDRAKTRDNLRMVGKNASGNRQSWPLRFYWTAILPKPATTRNRLGKFLEKSPIIAITFYWFTIVPKLATTRDLLGKILVGTANHGDFEELRRSDWLNGEGWRNSRD